MKQIYPNRLATLRALHSNQSLRYTLLCFFLVASQLTFAGGTPSLDFKNAVLQSGVAGKDGAIYRFSKIDGNIDALVKIKGRSDSLVYLASIDAYTSGFDKAFQPSIGYNKGTAPGAVDWWMDIEITFVDKGTNTPVIIDEFDLSGIDIDGNGDKIREYVSLYGLKSYVLENNSLLTATDVTKTVNGVTTITGKRFDGPTLNFLNIDTSGTPVMVTANYVKTSSFTARLGGVATAANGAAERMYSLFFKDFKFTDPMMILLPVRLESFAVTLSNGQPVLNWTAGSEKTLSHYLIERSTDGKEFSAVTMIFATGSSSAINYSFTDRAQIQSLVYYRLKMEDADGNFKYSVVKMVKANNSNAGSLAISTFPNPVANELRISIPASWQNKQVVYDLYTSNGHKIKHVVNGRAGQTETLQMNEMNAGIYVVKLTVGNESAIQQVVKM